MDFVCANCGLNTPHEDSVEHHGKLICHECADEINENKYGVPYRAYTITLADGRQFSINVGYEDDWGDIQRMNNDAGEYFKEGKGAIPTDWAERIGWGNDNDGHAEIVAVYDEENHTDLNVTEWAEGVFKYADLYSA